MYKVRKQGKLINGARNQDSGYHWGWGLRGACSVLFLGLDELDAFTL